MRSKNRKRVTDRAPPHNGAQELRPTPVASGQGLPCHERARSKKRAPTKKKIRFATWNIGTLTGRARELADVLIRRRVAVAFLQETRWKGSRSRYIGNGYKLIYTGAPGGENGVAIVLAEGLHDDILEVKRLSDRLMVVKVLIEGVQTHLISAYAPQAGCSDADKISFWNKLGDVLSGIPLSQDIVLGGDLNGHVGELGVDFERVHGGFGYGNRNTEGEEILRTCAAADLAVVNTFFKKKPDHLITYRSGRNATQIDFLLTRRHHISKVANCKVIPGESLTAQHRLLVMDLCVKPKDKRPEHFQRQIRWWMLDENKSHMLASAIGDKCDGAEGELVQKHWDRIQASVTEAAKAVLGMSKGGRKCDKETWWWDDTVQRETRVKKALFLKWQASNSPEDRDAYRLAKRATKRAVARARRLQDISKCRCVKDPDGNLLCEDLAVKERWRSYFHELLNKQHREVQPPDLPPNQGLVPPITPDEVQLALRRMKNRKAVGADGVPIEVWKAMGPRGVGILTNLFNRVWDTGRIPNQWRRRVITPVFKGKGSVQECGNYRGIKVMSHTMKLFERIVDSRLRQECIVSDCQYGFRPGHGTMDPVFALRIVMEKYRAKNTPLHFLFLDMQKAFDCVPRMMIPWALRSKGVPEVYVDIIRDMYRDSDSVVRTAVGDTTPFPVTVGVHQGSVLSPFLFSVILDSLSESIRDAHEQPPWLLMYADDIVLADADKGRLVQRVNRWKESLENGGLQLHVGKTDHQAPDLSSVVSDYRLIVL
ncbi:hypothetical protein B5X24_HaOG207038 [Helicoverpa armigera]|uniref:Reverse transcriptase domain-containing protein n=1 Tax=Helicoverpa armigera TaxID=29058 RepID=A0A2W1BJ69_HELAM|nr:hypothetical protein B5X24_HaOG207038 [Helicoverpa armigera]